MKATGIIRRVDKLGRIIIPGQLRKEYGIGPGDSMEILSTDDGFLIRHYRPGCAFCERVDGLATIHGRRICADCLEEIRSWMAVGQ